jgi:hypothetical protein
MKILAKFECGTVQALKEQETVSLSAVNGKNETANAQWAKYTPSGSVTLTINNPEARQKFAPGKFYLVTFEETTEEA